MAVRSKRPRLVLKRQYASEPTSPFSECYNQRLFGAPLYPHKFHVCFEGWKGKAPTRALHSVTCESSSEPITFAPDGWFHRAELHEDIENNPKDDYKDSLVIEVGKCAVISK